MSTYSTGHAPRNPSTSDLFDLALIGPKLISASLEQATEMLRLGPRIAAGVWPSFSSGRHSSCCCEIPEKHCPPCCACDIEWECCPGESLKAVVRVTNSSAHHQRAFQFTQKPFVVNGSPAPLTISPAGATLAPGQTTVVTVEFTPTSAFEPGQSYKAELLITGAYEQCVCFTLTLRRHCHAECDVHQGDPPVHIRPHQWYDHFQCTEPCFPHEGERRH
jgi:hypothetical protein